MLIPLLIALAFILLSALPATRPIVGWCFSIILIPIYVLQRIRLKPSLASESIEIDDSRLPTATRFFLKTNAEVLTSLGFEHRGIFYSYKSNGLSTFVFSGYVHPARGITAILMTTDNDGLAWTSYFSMSAEKTEGRISVSTQNSPPMAHEETDRAWYLPSLRTVALQARAFEALSAQFPAAEIPATPQSSEEMLKQLEESRTREIERYITAGLYTRRSDGITRPTLKGAIAFIKQDLWPWKPARLQRALAREREILQRHGLTSLLTEPQPETHQVSNTPTNLSVGLQFPDDRGVMRSTASLASIDRDERSGDPRFRALMAQSQSARKRQFRTGGAWTGMGSAVVAIIGVVVFRLPVWFVVLGCIIVAAIISSIINHGRIRIAEDAARNVLIHRGICPACTYSLANLPIDPDGCLTCPECGAAWKRERIHDFATFESVGHDELSPVRRASEIFSAGNVEGTNFRDDRHVKCRLVNPRLHNEILAASDDLRPRLETAAKANRSNGRVMRISAAIFVGLLFVGVPLGIVVVIAMRGPAVPWTFLPLGIGVVFGGFLVLGILRGNFAYNRKRIVQTLVEQSVCPSCAADIRDLPIQPDGCKLCQCGSAWRFGPATVPPTTPPKF